MVQIYNVTYNYNSGEGLQQINLNIKPGEFVYLIGPSGAGKSTILKLIYMELLPISGHVIVSNYNSLTIKKRHIPHLRRKLGIIFQDFKLLNDRNVFDNVAFTLQVIGTNTKNIKKKVLRVLSEVGLNHKRNKMPTQLSGGEQQKVAIARALVNEPFVLLADEPTGNLDAKATKEIMQLLDKINIKGTAILMATHNNKLIADNRKKIIQIKNGMIS